MESVKFETWAHVNNIYSNMDAHKFNLCCIILNISVFSHSSMQSVLYWTNRSQLNEEQKDFGSENIWKKQEKIDQLTHCFPRCAYLTEHFLIYQDHSQEHFVNNGNFFISINTITFFYAILGRGSKELLKSLLFARKWSKSLMVFEGHFSSPIFGSAVEEIINVPMSYES